MSFLAKVQKVEAISENLSWQIDKIAESNPKEVIEFLIWHASLKHREAPPDYDIKADSVKAVMDLIGKIAQHYK